MSGTQLLKKIIIFPGEYLLYMKAKLRRFLSFGFSLIKCDQHKEKELILKTHFDCLGL